MGRRYDALVAGGSVAGLAFAAEAAELGLSVLVVEEHQVIGEPEKCDGLVSLRGLRNYGFEPEPNVIQNRIARGVVHSPGGKSVTLDADGLEVVVLDRSEFDKQLAARAESGGAELMVGARAALTSESGDGVTANIGGTHHAARYFVDATGPSSFHRKGILPAAKYEIEADWVAADSVEVFPDAEKYPGFFAWVIPFGGNLAKVGVAGRGIDAFEALDSFLATRPHKRIRRVAAPIYLGGPLDQFVSGRTIRVGEAAGQVKPSTAGGIVTSIAGASIAARWLHRSITLGARERLSGYQSEWESRYLKEMRSMLRLRGVFEKLSNRDIDVVVGAFSSHRFRSRVSRSDFDFHASAILGALGVSGTLRLAKAVASAEARSLLAGANPREPQQPI